MVTKKKVKKGNPQDEQLLLLRQILIELKTLNANLAATKLVPPSPIGDLETNADDIDNDDEEEEDLEYFE